MSATPTPKDEQFWRLTESVAKDAFRITKERLSKGEKFENKPNIYISSEGESGKYPQTESKWKVPDYSSLFARDNEGWLNKNRIAYKDLAGFQELLTYVTQNESYRNFLDRPAEMSSEFLANVLAIETASIPLGIMERHLNIVGQDWDADFAMSTFCELEAWITDDVHPVDLYVPLLGISFELDSFQVTDTIKVQRMTLEEHSAKFPTVTMSWTERRLATIATHAVIISGVEVSWPHALFGSEIFEGEFPYTAIDQLIQAIAIVTGTQTGVSQVAFKPLGWAPGYRADMDALRHSFFYERYASRIDLEASEPSEVVSIEDINKIVQRYRSLQVSHAQVLLAASRLQSATLRGQELDEIVDQCIGIEALLGGSQPGETTYKLAIRCAAVMAHAGYVNSAFIAGNLKKVYSYRSLIVHGQAKFAKKRVVKFDDSTEFLASDVAGFYLRTLLDILLEKPELVAKIDSDEVIFDYFIGPSQQQDT